MNRVALVFVWSGTRGEPDPEPSPAVLCKHVLHVRRSTGARDRDAEHGTPAVHLLVNLSEHLSVTSVRPRVYYVQH